MSQQSILDKVSTQQSWACLCDVKQQPVLAEALTKASSIESLISQLESLPVTLKDNHRSLVKCGNMVMIERALGRSLEVVAKRPVDKHRRRLSRLSSMLVAGEAAATIENLAKLKNAGIQSVTPLFALEKRRNGQIVDSWMCYEYRQGSSCDEQDMDDIIKFLNQMHASGFRHGDPTWSNFLRDESGELFTIDTKAKPCRGAFHATQDFLLFKGANGLDKLEIASVMPVDRASLGYWAARLYVGFKAVRSGLRDRIKKNRPKNS